MRGKYQNKLPDKIYFVDNGHNILGPYIKMPTLIIKRMFVPPTLIIYVKDEHGNYIKTI